MPEILESVRPILIAFGLKVLGAIVAFVVGRQLIGLAAGSSRARAEQVEPTVIGYIRSVVTVALNVILVVALLGYFGIETTSFAARWPASALRLVRPGAGFSQFRCRDLHPRAPAIQDRRLRHGRRRRGSRAGDRHVQHHDRYP